MGDLIIHRRIPVAETLTHYAFRRRFEIWLCSRCCWPCLIGVPVGIASASRRNFVARWCHAWSVPLVGVSMPIFWLGLMEIMLFAVLLAVAASSAGRLGTAIRSSRAVTNFVLLDSYHQLAIAPRCIHALQHLCIMPADCPGDHSNGHHCPHDAFQHAGCAARRLHPHGEGQGACRAGGAFQGMRSRMHFCLSSRSSAFRRAPCLQGQSEPKRSSPGQELASGYMIPFWRGTIRLSKAQPC